MSLGLSRPLMSVVSTIKAIVAEFRNRDVPFMAGSIAYYAFLSLFPTLLLVFLLISIIGDERLAAFVTTATESYLTPTAQELLVDTIRETSGRVQLSIIAIFTLLWGVTSVFRGLDTAFSKLYGTSGQNSFLDKIVNGIVVIVGMTVATLAMFLAATVYAFFPELPFVEQFNLLFLTVALVIMFLPIYYVFPDVDVSLREILPGAVLAAIGWSLLQFVFQVYVTYSSKAELYGVLGGILLVVTWLYFAALVLLLGAATNAVLWTKTGQESIAESGQSADE